MVKLGTTIGDLIKEYFNRIGKSNLIIKNLKRNKIRFQYELKCLNYYEELKIEKMLSNYSEIYVVHDFSKNDNNFEIDINNEKIINNNNKKKNAPSSSNRLRRARGASDHLHLHPSGAPLP